MNRAIRQATGKRFHYESHEQLQTHLADFVAAYKFFPSAQGSGLTPFKHIAKV